MTATGRATPTDPAGTTANPTPGDDCGRCSPVNAASTNWPTIAPPPCTCNPWPTPRTPATSSPNRYGISPTRSGSRKGKRLAAPPHSPGRRRSTFGSPKASTSATLSTHLPSCWPATQDPDPVHPCGTRPGPYTRLRLGRLGADAPPDHREIDAVEQHFGSGVATEARVHQPVVLTAGDAAHATEHTEHTDGLHRLHRAPALSAVVSEVGAKVNASWRPPPADFCDAPPVALHRRRSEQPRTAGRLKSRVTEGPSPYRVRGRLLRAPPTTATLLTGRARGRSRGYPPTSARPPERHRPDLQRHHQPHVQPHGDRPVARPTQWGHHRPRPGLDRDCWPALRCNLRRARGPARDLCRPGRCRHHHAVRHPGPHPAHRHGRGRRDRPGPYRHRQDPRLRHSDLAADDGSGQRYAASAHRRTDSRAVRPGR